ncbi:MAG: 2-C-methyl-D-erythritol 2,4-cyclodiphosphate synthase [Defluviitaleaceae bacterium]|nr:2-C-methyl-D-erythritol 2,4-cyclodiphosphate synthase [Defluviitaleaceae bacterium]
MSFRIGNGYDAHRLAAGRALVLGGVTVPFEKGLLGHSDADVLTHAVIDALLGAARLGDIGRHFPDTDPAYDGISSLELLFRAGNMIKQSGFNIVNIDSIIVAQRPRLAPYVPEMERSIASRLGIPADACGVKATTEEGMGFTGAGEGMAAYACCLLEKTREKYRFV